MGERRAAPYRERMRSTLLSVSCLLAAGCSTSAAKFVEGQPAYSVTSGRLVTVDGLTAGAVTDLSDGVAFKVTSGTCRATIAFDDGTERTIDLLAPAMLVCGAERQYVLQPVAGSTARQKP